MIRRMAKPIKKPATKPAKKSKGADLEKSYPNKAVAEKLRRLADALAEGKSCAIQVAGKRVRVPSSAKVEIEYEETKTTAELEIEVSWKVAKA